MIRPFGLFDQHLMKEYDGVARSRSFRTSGSSS